MEREICPHLLGLRSLLLRIASRSTHAKFTHNQYLGATVPHKPATARLFTRGPTVDIRQS